MHQYWRVILFGESHFGGDKGG